MTSIVDFARALLSLLPFIEQLMDDIRTVSEMDSGQYEEWQIVKTFEIFS